jgi:flagellar assembly factor FliW
MAMILDKRTTYPDLVVACDEPAASASAEQPASDAAPSSQTTIQVQTTRFGLIEADEDLVITFPEGLIGFENCTRYLVVRHDDNSAFRWLQSLDSPPIAFPIIEPGILRPDYAPTISESDVRLLGLSPEDPTLLFVVVTIPAHAPRAMTANLLAPLVIHGVTRQARQVILQEEGYTTRHEVVKELERARSMTLSMEAVTGPTAPKERTLIQEGQTV